MKKDELLKKISKVEEIGKNNNLAGVIDWASKAKNYVEKYYDTEHREQVIEDVVSTLKKIGMM